jgi:adenine-specific DNA methylase
LLKENGKIGFVIPAELLQVSYAQQLGAFLAHYYNKINIISFEKLVFPDIQQEVVLLLCERSRSDTHLIEHIELKDASHLKRLDVNRLKSPTKKIDFKSNKWTYYFLEQDEIDFLENISTKRKVPTIGDYANVEVGITTGANDYFTVPYSTVAFYQLEKFDRK